MNRRDTIKTLFVGGIGSSLVLTSCMQEQETPIAELKEGTIENYGRTPAEAARDEYLVSKNFFTDDELQTIAILSDIIIPADDTSGSATEAEVPAFIEFISKDMPEHQTPLRGGIMWLNHESNRRFNKVFNALDEDSQLSIIDDIAYPEEVKPELQQGANFFSRIRNLVTTGYFTSKIGIEYLGYKGNIPNAWDGVPQDVLDEHNMKYDDRMLKTSIKMEERGEIMDWSNYKV
ncbi:gluconate 2-dehydrogenase subunit 3 family protein [Flavimarina sp. Hel_I_48]|uniref:gluconate 2-dehydrogenase subunit 3 family protein n=1 Tax=Flavimarina sp. Hel_I_48 TaxID=1392488 RepID=UPI0004DF2E8F|nr:gluconate 2-dehydrogenase subunit 3 family protein [Flavimarina sp. Hel_I_48]